MGVVQRGLGVALVVVLLLVGTVLAGPARGDAGQEAELFELVNGFRARRGVARLSQDAQLAAVAGAWAGRMQATGTLSHNPSLAVQVTSDWEKVGEIVGAGPDVPTVHQAFMSSGVHSGKMLDPAFTHVGIGTASGPDGKIWVVEAFMGLRGTSVAPTTTASPRTTVAPPSDDAPPTTAAARAPRTASSAPPAPAPRPRRAQEPAAVGPPAPPAVEAAAAAPPPAAPPLRLVLVLERLRALDAEPTEVPDWHSLDEGWNARSES